MPITSIRTLAPVFFALFVSAVTSTTPLSAQDTLFIVDSSDDRVLRLVDLDGDGMFDPSLEATIYYDDSSPGPDLSTPQHCVAIGDALYVADGGTLDAILVLTDLDGDGDALAANEITTFYDDSAPGVDLGTPNGFVVAGDGTFYVSDDGSAVKSVVAMRDLDGNGDALGTGESWVFFDGVGAGVLDDPEAIALADDGRIFVADATTQTVHALVDGNGDDDAMDPGERVLFADLSAFGFSDIESLAWDETSESLYIVDEDSGRVAIADDTDADGVATSAGEVIVILDGPTVTDANDTILVAPGVLWIADGALDAIVRASDDDGSDIIESPSETPLILDDGGALLATPSGIAFVPDAAPTVAPVLTAIQPTTGSTAGGTAVTLTGSGFTDASTVRIGGTGVVFQVVDDQTISTFSPPRALGVFDVTVESPGGSSLLAGVWIAQNPFVRGDGDGNGILEVTDAILALGYVTGQLDPLCTVALDAQDDGQIDISDASYLLAFIFQGGPPPASPFPAPGIDETFDGSYCD